MLRKPLTLIPLCLLVALVVVGVASAGSPVGAGFTYQGSLKQGGSPANGTYDFEFSLYDAVTGGAQVGSTQTKTGVTVSNGLFTVQLDFGSTAFLGEARWLEIAVRQSGGGSYTPLNPRQPLTAAPQALFAAGAQGAPRTYTPLLRPQPLDLYNDGANPYTRNFLGGFTDGRYGYLVPGFIGEWGHGRFVRLDLQDFTLANTVTLDLTTINPNLTGFVGGFTDGRYGYLVPYNTGNNAYHGRLVRVDLQNFSAGGVTVLDLTEGGAHPDRVNFTGGFTDGRYGYLSPNVPPHATVRVDLVNFDNAHVVERTFPADVNPIGYWGGFTDGRYAYYVPNVGGSWSMVSSKLARIELQNFETAPIEVLDLESFDAGLRAFRGGFTDGRYGYMVACAPDVNGFCGFAKVARVDLQNFTVSGITVLNLTDVNSNLRGLQGGFTDGRYGYFAPWSSSWGGSSGQHGWLARVDLQNFTTSGVAYENLADTNASLVGFFGGGFTDGRYGYLVPYNFHVARIQLFSGAGQP